MPLKDFIDEARGILDIQHYLNEAALISSLSPSSSLEEAALALVPQDVDDLSPADLLKDVLFSPNGQAASCQVVSQTVSRPKVIIGKLAEPIDEELKLVILVINPLKKKFGKTAEISKNHNRMYHFKNRDLNLKTSLIFYHQYVLIIHIDNTY